MGKHRKRKAIAASSRRVWGVGWIGGGIALAAVVTVGVAVFAGRSDEKATPLVTGSTAIQSQLSTFPLPVIDVYKSPTCGCCSKWVDHLRQAGFEVRTTDTRDLADFKAGHGVPRQVESCHTALAGGYVLEGHVPAADVKRLLRERPAITGLAVPGMPIGSPGMEVPGTEAEPYEVVAFDKDGDTEVFARHGG